uniref:MYND-type domain-containing protein n=1 Tax=Strigamia maritima TaxID=126957 RepID=T1IMZ4_STRMM
MSLGSAMMMIKRNIKEFAAALRSLKTESDQELKNVYDQERRFAFKIPTVCLGNEWRGNYCDYCFKQNDNLKKCTQCSHSYYCDKNCQKSAWKDPKNECLCLKLRYPATATDCLGLTDDVRLTRKPNECEKFGDVSRRFQDLMSHSEDDMKDSIDLMMMKSLTLEMVMCFIREEYCPSFRELSEIYGKAFINTFRIHDDGKKLGKGLYLGASILDHSCQPNASFVFDGPTLLLTATEDIPQLDASNVFISYVGTLASTKERQDRLKQIYYFDCTCIKCQDVESDLIKRSIVCPNANCTYPTVIKNGSFNCFNCGKVKFEKGKQSQVEKLTDKCQKALHEMNELNESNRFEESYKIAEKCIEQMNTTLHLHNILYVQILLSVCESSQFLSK